MPATLYPVTIQKTGQKELTEELFKGKGGRGERTDEDYEERGGGGVGIGGRFECVNEGKRRWRSRRRSERRKMMRRKRKKQSMRKWIRKIMSRWRKVCK